jgi:hypothetical protein
MKTDLFIPLLALVALATATAGASLISFPSDAPNDGRIVDLPGVTVHPSRQDAAHFQAHRIVDLPRITVRPAPANLALSLADEAAHLVDFTAPLPQPAMPDYALATR